MIWKIEFVVYAKLRTLAMGLAVVLLLAVSSVLAQSGFEAGADAYQRGDYKTALNFFRPLAENGEPKAQTILGLMYSYGEGVGVDFREAAMWYRRAAKQDYSVAQYSLAMLYLQGKGVPLDTDEAVKWLTLAAEGGHDRAKGQLRQMGSVADSYLAAKVKDPLAARSPTGAAQASGDSVSSDADADASGDRRSEKVATSRMLAQAAVPPAPPVKAARLTSASDTEIAPGAAAQAPADVKAATNYRGQFHVQLAASTSEASIRKDWSGYQKRHGDLFEGLEGRIVRAEVGEGKVVWYRLRVGAFPTTAKARELCDELRQRGLEAGCLTMRAAPVPAAGSAGPAEPVAFSGAPGIDAFVRAWADAWSRQAVEDYLAHYSKDFQPTDGSSRAAWEAVRRQRLIRPKFIEIKVSDMEIESLGENRASATFRQIYRADRYQDVVDKTLALVRDGDRWQIVGEVSR